jgi:hypothetical protein
MLKINSQRTYLAVKCGRFGHVAVSLSHEQTGTIVILIESDDVQPFSVTLHERCCLVRRCGRDAQELNELRIYAAYITF